MASTSRVTLDHWEELAPLSARARKSIVALQDSSAVPKQLSALLIESSGLTRSPSADLSLRSRQHTNHAHSDSASIHAQHHPVENAQEFFDWFAQVESAIERDQDIIYRSYLADLETRVALCDDILEQIADCDAYLRELTANFAFVQDNSHALQVACENMLQHQKKLLRFSDAVSSYLDYFKELDSATRLLNLPGDTFVLREDYAQIMERLDTCLDFLRQHPNYKDADIYVIRFQQCLTRAMTLIKMYFVKTVAQVGNEVAEKLEKKGLGETARNAILYDKFFTLADNLRGIIMQMETRALSNPMEYSSLISEAQDVWFTTRRRLLAAPISSEIAHMQPTSGDLAQLARTGCGFLRNVCKGEWQLFHKLFGLTDSNAILLFLETLCDFLYDSMRPRILHEPKLEILCEVCTVLQALVALDKSSDNPNASNDITISPSVFLFGPLLETVLHDAQTRLVFRAQTVIHTEVLRYQPTDADIPMLATANPATFASNTESDTKLPRIQHMSKLFTPLKTTLVTLSQMHSHVKETIFQDFADEALNSCKIAIETTAAKMQTAPELPSYAPQLFAISNLLALSRITQSIRIVAADWTLDISALAGRLSSLLTSNPAYFFGSQTPFNTRDSKMDLAASLKRWCELLIDLVVKHISKELQSFISRARAITDTQAASKSDAKADWIQPQAVQTTANSVIQQMEADLEIVLRQLQEWLTDASIVEVMMEPIKAQVIEIYATFAKCAYQDLRLEGQVDLLSPVVVQQRLAKIV